MAAETVVVVNGVVRCGTGEVCEGGRPFILDGRGGDSSAEVTGRSRAVFCGGLFEEGEDRGRFPGEAVEACCWRAGEGESAKRGGDIRVKPQKFVAEARV